MKIERFEDIIAWQKSKILSAEIYNIFRNVRDFSFRDQILRAVVSVMNNIAEGFERRTNQEFKHFLFISKGSCAEVRSMLSLSLDLRYIDAVKCADLTGKCEEISKILSGLIKTL